MLRQGKRNRLQRVWCLKMCEYCLNDICPPGCPNYQPPQSNYCCTICKEPILDGEEYIENDFGERRHYDCFVTFRELLSWLGYEIKIMEG